MLKWLANDEHLVKYLTQIILCNYRMFTTLQSEDIAISGRPFRDSSI